MNIITAPTVIRKSKRSGLHLPCAALLLPLLCTVACTTPKKAPPAAAANTTNAYLVATAQAPLYIHGPAQGSGPDLQLSKGQRVTLLDRRFGFGHVRTADGVVGYLPAGSLQPAPPEPPPPPPPVVAGPGPAARPQPAAGPLESLDLPLPENPTPPADH